MAKKTTKPIPIDASALTDAELNEMVNAQMALKRARLDKQEKRLFEKLAADDSNQKQILLRNAKIATIRVNVAAEKQQIKVLRDEIKALKPARRRKNADVTTESAAA